MRFYHGTTKENAEAIIRGGFRAYTYYTPYLDVALSMGGPYVFVLSFPDVSEKDLANGKWEWLIDHPIYSADIVALVHYGDVTLEYFDREARRRGGQHEPNECPTCKGTGELNYVDDGQDLLPGGASFRCPHKEGKETEICPVCKGYGKIQQRE